MSNWTSDDLDSVAQRFGWERKSVHHDMTEGGDYDTVVVYTFGEHIVTAEFNHRGSVYGDYLARVTHQVTGEDSHYRRVTNDDTSRDAFGLAVEWMVDAARVRVG